MEEMNWGSFFILALFPLGMILYLLVDLYAAKHGTHHHMTEKKQH